MSISKIPTLIHGIIHGPHKPDEFAKYGYNGPDLQNQREFDIAKQWKHMGVYLGHDHSEGPCGTVLNIKETKDGKLAANLWIEPSKPQGKKILDGLMDGTITQLSLGQRNTVNKDGLNIKEIRPLEISVVKEGGRDDCKIKWFTNNNNKIQMANPVGFTPELFQDFLGVIKEQGIPPEGFKEYILASKKRQVDEKTAIETARVNKRIAFVNGLSELVTGNPELAIIRDDLPTPAVLDGLDDKVIDIFASIETNYRTVNEERKRLIVESLKATEEQKALKAAAAQLQVELTYEKSRNANRQDRVQPAQQASSYTPAYVPAPQQLGGAAPASSTPSAYVRVPQDVGVFPPSEYGPSGSGQNRPKAQMSGGVPPNMFDYGV